MCGCTSNNKNTTTSSNMMFLDPGNIVTTKATSNNSFAYNLELPPMDIRGYVTNEFGEPLSKAHVYVTENFGTYTDDNGFFMLEDVAHDELITISHQGFGTLLQEPSEDMGMIVLESEAIPMDAVIINAPSGAAQSANEKEPFPWRTLLIGVGTTVASGLIIRALTRPKTFKGTV